MNSFHVHLVSDSTGETVILVARASLVQFEQIEPQEHHWTMIRSPNQVEGVLKGIADNPGFVIFTLVNTENRKILEEGCRRLQLPCVPVLDPVVAGLGTYLGAEIHARPGGQHVLDDEYFNRIEAMQFALSHDDGQSTWDINDADVVLMGVSRTSKTPTSIYLANRGIKTANIPLVPGCPIPEEIFEAKNPLIIGLTKDPKRLVEIRRQRLRMINQDENTDYVDLEMVSKEINDARRLYTKHDWAVINVSRKSIEETAATIIKMYQEHQETSL
ncbi:MAG: pyruvate, water dikinase regulatory protein [Rhodospirillales bacterium]|jgi:regulator of PEP synthase PpsR (kinase-PPPase family)|tara:strand:- start:834 stop:1652 length:819 start_codon:yes stop_codon:yes gene_type:complete